MNVKDKYLLCIRCMTYNHSAYIKDALDGFCMQKASFPFYVVLFDDASNDGTQDAIKAYMDKHFDHSEETGFSQWESDEALYTFARHKENSNCYFLAVFLKKNLYKTLRKDELIAEWCVAKYIALCEGDDYWIDPLKVQKQVDFMEEHEEVGMCFTDYCVRNQQGKISQPVFKTGMDRIPSGFEDHLLRSGYIAPMTWMWRLSCQKLIQDGKFFSDGSFAIALRLYKNSKVAFIEDATCVYRMTEGSASRPKSRKEQFEYQLGVYKTQMYYSDKYKVGSELVDRIKSKAYFQMLPLALEAGEKEFVSEAEAFFDSKNMYFPELLALCRGKIDLQKHYNKAQKELGVVRKSKAYKLGHVLLDPFRKFIK